MVRIEKPPKGTEGFDPVTGDKTRSFTPKQMDELRQYSRQESVGMVDKLKAKVIGRVRDNLDKKINDPSTDKNKLGLLTAKKELASFKQEYFNGEKTLSKAEFKEKVNELKETIANEKEMLKSVKNSKKKV